MKRLQNPRANTITNDAYVGPEGQLTVDSDRWELRLHDNETPGGHRILNLQQLIEIFMSKDSEFGQVVFAEDDRGVLTRIGDRQYALRSLIGYNGIHVTENAVDDVLNPKGTGADFYIGIDPDDLATLLLGLAAGKLLYAGLSTGTADALQLTVPLGWKNDQGSIVAFKSHIDVNDAATMQITTGVTAGSVLPIQTTSGSNKISQLINHYTVVLLMRINDTDAGDPDPVDAYRIINLVVPKELGIAPITGMTATNVQDALEELKDGLDGGGGGGGSLGGFYTFANPGQAVPSNKKMPLADGEYRLVKGAAPGGSVHSGGSGGSTSAVNGVLTFNGVGIQGELTSGGNAVAPIGYSKGALGIVHRIGTQIWFCPIQLSVLANSTSVFFYGSRFRCGTVLADATEVLTQNLSGDFGGGGNWTYSDNGEVAT